MDAKMAARIAALRGRQIKTEACLDASRRLQAECAARERRRATARAARAAEVAGREDAEIAAELEEAERENAARITRWLAEMHPA